MEKLLFKLADVVNQAGDLESLTRPLLAMLESLTGMESTYLTRIDLEAGVQHVITAKNAQSLQIPEGLSVPWKDTLCKRALDEGRGYTDDVGGCWGDSDAARQLGIRTYLSEPVYTPDGNLYGTLCAASSHAVAIDQPIVEVLKLFARLLGQQIAREQALEALRSRNEQLQSQALIDPLTGVANRRGLMTALQQRLAQARRNGQPLWVAFVDLDGFKRLNDRHGHAVGDRFLIHVARQLRQAVRAEDLVARYGGDEFVIVASGIDGESLSTRLETQLFQLYQDSEQDVAVHGSGSIGVVSATDRDDDADGLLALADQAMYAIKQARQRAAATNGDSSLQTV